MALPSYYLERIGRDKKRGDERAEGLDQAAAGMTSSLGALQALQAKTSAAELAAKLRADDIARKDAEVKRDQTNRDREFNYKTGKDTADAVTGATKEARAARKDEADMESESKKQGRTVLQSVVRDALAGGKSLEDLLPSAREMPALESLTGDEEVAGEYESQKRKRDEYEMDLVQQELNRKSRERAANLARSDRRDERATAVETRREDKAMAIEARREEKAAATEDKKKAQVVEVENFVANIKDNINALRKQVKDTGTFEMFGSESADLERAMTNIAVDMAKLQDPGSVAREGEVALVKKGLFPTGLKALGTRNATADKILENMLSEVEKRRSNAYTVRGLSPGGKQPVAAGNDEEKKKMMRELKAQGLPPADILKAVEEVYGP